MKKVYTSLYISQGLKIKMQMCAKKLDVDQTTLLSVLCYKAGKFVCKEAQCFKTVEYQDPADDYVILPVYFFAADHEYMHCNRLACKVSVSKLLAFAMTMFLDEIMEKGINQSEVANVRVIQHSYKKRSYKYRNFMFKITKNDQFEEYKMKMRMGKT